VNDRRILVALGSLALAVALGLTASGRAASSGQDRTSRGGGIFKISLNAASGIDYLDPALASTPPAWTLLDTTCARLLSYPDKAPPDGFRLQPEVAASVPVASNDGRTYTFTLRRGFRFSDGKPVRASAFARAINRVLAPAMHSPGVQFARDIVGAGQVVSGKTTAASGVVAHGNTLVVRLTRAAPDFPQRMASMFFCAVPPTLPLDAEGAGAFPAAGPYYVVDYKPAERVVIRRNPYYGGRRPHHVDGYDVDLRAASPQDVVKRVDRGDADWGYTLSGIYFDPTLGLVERYGVNRSQFYVKPGLTMRMIAFNLSRPLFRDNPGLRKAVNFALNRRALVAAGGSLVSRPTDQYLPSILPGFRNADVYPLDHAELKRARVLAEGNLRGAKAILYVNSSAIPMAIGNLVRQQLAEIGLDVVVTGIPIHSASAAYFAKLATPGEPWDLAFGLWSPSYIDPFAYINLLFDRRFLGASNFTRFASAPVNEQMRRAARLPQGSDRSSAYAALDVRLARDLAPAAAVDFLNEVTLVSGRVDLGCVALRPVLDLTAVCLK